MPKRFTRNTNNINDITKYDKEVGTVGDLYLDTNGQAYIFNGKEYKKLTDQTASLPNPAKWLFPAQPGYAEQYTQIEPGKITLEKDFSDGKGTVLMDVGQSIHDLQQKSSGGSSVFTKTQTIDVLALDPDNFDGGKIILNRVDKTVTVSYQLIPKHAPIEYNPKTLTIDNDFIPVFGHVLNVNGDRFTDNVSDFRGTSSNDGLTNVNTDLTINGTSITIRPGAISGQGGNTLTGNFAYIAQ